MRRYCAIMGVSWASADMRRTRYAGKFIRSKRNCSQRRSSHRAVEPQEFSAVTLAKGRILERMAKLHFQFAVRDALVCHAATARCIEIFRLGWRQRFVHGLREPLEKMQLANRFVVHCVVDLADAS